MASATGGTLAGPDADVEGASFDTRSLRPGQLFVPIVAERDGHDFIESALAAGAGAYLTSRAPSAGTAIRVADTALALMELAAWARDRLTANVVGITGSVGKTSTKDLIAGAVGAGRRLTANERSFNNEQGLPVTILGAPDDAEVLVLEMGMRGFGEIRRLCDVARPSIGVVTAVGRSHTGLVGRHRRCRAGEARVGRGLAERRHRGAQRRRRTRRGDGRSLVGRNADVRDDATPPTCGPRRSRSTTSVGPGSPYAPRGARCRCVWP